MIDMKQCLRFCRKEDIPNIEGYGLAVSSPLKFVIHHRNEVQPDGVICSKKWLQEHHLYYGRPAHELIFMEDSAHRSLHTRAYWDNPHYEGIRKGAASKTAAKAQSEGRKEALSRRTRALWDEKRAALCAAMRKGKDTAFKRMYGLTIEGVAAKLGFTKWKVQTLHKKGELAACL